MRSDSLGNPVSAADAAALAAVDDFLEGFLAYEERAANILGAAETFPDNALINAYAGLLWMLLEAPEAPARAAKYLRRAEAAAAGATRREQLIVQLLAAWTARRRPPGHPACDDIAAAFPRDLAVVKLNQYLNFNLGRFPRCCAPARRCSRPTATWPICTA